MNLREADAYFKAVAGELVTPLVVVLTGGMAASILADERTTDDIDFALLKYAGKDLPKIEALVQRLADKHNILVQYSGDIGRWSMVSFLDWKKHSRPYKRIGFLEIRVLDPYYWSIGKITRGTATDIKDLKAVARSQSLDPKKLARLWAKALKKSPPSTQLANVKRQMETFFKESRTGVFKSSDDPQAALESFRKLLMRKKD